MFTWKPLAFKTSSDNKLVSLKTPQSPFRVEKWRIIEHREEEEEWLITSSGFKLFMPQSSRDLKTKNCWKSEPSVSGTHWKPSIITFSLWGSSSYVLSVLHLLNQPHVLQPISLNTADSLDLLYTSLVLCVAWDTANNIIQYSVSVMLSDMPGTWNRAVYKDKLSALKNICTWLQTVMRSQIVHYIITVG